MIIRKSSNRINFLIILCRKPRRKPAGISGSTILLVTSSIANRMACEDQGIKPFRKGVDDQELIAYLKSLPE